MLWVIILGDQRVIHDKMLTGCVQAGHCLTGRVFPVGQFYFFCPSGPPLSNLLAMEAADYLGSLGVELTREGLCRQADKFGRLWHWYDQRAGDDCMPQLRNTDGDDLVLQTASFSIADEKVVREVMMN